MPIFIIETEKTIRRTITYEIEAEDKQEALWLCAKNMKTGENPGPDQEDGELFVSIQEKED